MSKAYTVTAKRWAHGWELHVKGLGVTQTRSLALAERDATDYIESMTDKAPASVTVTPDLEDKAAAVAALHEAQDKAQRAVQLAAKAQRNLIAELSGDGLSKNDIARVLDVSPQRISQLVKS